jgi:uncharacterized cupredoxin-like copper-binding protein
MIDGMNEHATHQQPPNVVRSTLWACATVASLCLGLLGIGACTGSGAAVIVPKDATRVDVALSNYAIRFEPGAAIAHGKIAFVVTNNGTIPHELVMFGGVSGSSQLPVGKDGDVNEDSPRLTNVLDSGASLAPHQTKVFVEAIAAGHYVAVCNLPAHWKLGMHLDVTVK